MSDEHLEHDSQNSNTGSHYSVSDYLHRDKITLQDLYNHMLGPAISLVIHIILLVVIGTMVFFDPPVKQREELVIETTVVPVTEPPKPPPEPEQIDPVINEFVDSGIERPSIQTETVSIAPVSDVSVQGNTIADVDFSSTISINNNSALKLSGFYASRSDIGRQTAVKTYGGSSQTERAVALALNWLAKAQNEDGSWGTLKSKDNVPALTAVATLTFLARGETPQSAQHGETVLKALKMLASYTEHLDDQHPLIDNAGNGYAHAMVAYAVSEGYAMTKIPMLEHAMNRIIKTIVDGQNSFGGYDYNFKKNLTQPDPVKGTVPIGYAVGDPRCDLSVAGWNYQALKAAYSAGCKVPGLDEALDKGVKCIKTINMGKNGSFTYDNSRGQKGGTASMTSVGTLCLQLMGAGRSVEAKNGLRWIENLPTGPKGEPLTMDWKKPPSGNMPLYTWYYMTQAIFQGTNGDGRTWNQWNKSMKETLLKEQDRDGSWRSPVDKYSKDPSGHESGAQKGTFTEHGIKVWSTAMCTLMLEVYYRFLPTFKVADEAPQPSGTAVKAGDNSFDDLTI